MCGIAGFVNQTGRPARAADVLRMCAAIRHRGPDDTGIGTYGPVGLGNTRLKIIDLSETANQPISNEDASIHVVFNGEIYNYRDLRTELIANGHIFRSQSDTEVLVHLYEEMGPSFVKKLDGMFALALWDDRNRRLVLARDRAGKKPLFYYHDREVFALASEIKALLTLGSVPVEVASEYLPTYLSFGYVPCPETLYRGIRQIPPGHVAVLHAGVLHVESFWRLAMEPDESIQFGEACEQVRVLLRQAVRKRLISDVPLGVLLSGGVDSSIVTALASHELGKVKTFCAVFPEDPAFNEGEFASIVAKRFGTDHHELEVRMDGGHLLEKLVYHHDQPFADSSAVATYLISLLARQHVTVVLNGDGGDELFAGYKRFWTFQKMQQVPLGLLRSLNWIASLVGLKRKRSGKRFQRQIAVASQPRRDQYAFHIGLFLSSVNEVVRPEVLRDSVDPLFNYHKVEQETAGLPSLARLLFINYREYLLNDLNVKMDRCTMANSLEARSPLLDTALTEYVSKLPDPYKLHGTTRKYLLKKAFEEMFPAGFLERRKRGFMVPLERWLRTDMKEMVSDLLLSSDALLFQYLQPQVVKRFVTEQYTAQMNRTDHLWSLLTLEIWLRSHQLFRRQFSNMEMTRAASASFEVQI